MADLSTLPLIDWFETTLAQQYTGGLGTMYVNDTPDFTFPSWVKTYAVVNPGKSIQQVVEIDSMGVGTLNVSSVTVEKGAGVNYTVQTHSANNKVIISDNYQFWKDIRTAVNTKLDTNGGNWVDYADTAARDAALGADGAATKNYRNIKAWSAYYNYNLSLGQWQIISTGTAPSNASQTAAGVVEAPTTPQQVAWTTTGETWALLFSTPDYVKTVNDNAVAEALKIKSKVDVASATTGNITLSGIQTVDGIAGAASQRVLVRANTAWQENGIWLQNAWAWTRATDFDANVNNEVDLGANVWVQWGTVNAGTMWTMVTTGAITVGTTPIVFECIGSFGNMNYKKTSITSTTARISADTERTTTSTTQVLKKTFIVPFSGVVNVYFEIKATTPYFASYSVYRNWFIIAATSSNTTSTSYTPLNFDINVWEWDWIDVYLGTQNPAATAYVKNARLRYDISAGNVGVVITD